MIGVGILAGPLAGVAGAHLFAGVAGAKMTILAVYAATAATGFFLMRGTRRGAGQSI